MSLIGALLFGGCAHTSASSPATRMVAVPSMNGQLPDGSPVQAIVIVPAENVLHRTQAWQDWEAAYPPICLRRRACR